MDNVTEIIALLRKQAALESQILNGTGTAVASERELEVTRRRLAAHPQALNGVTSRKGPLRTLRAAGRYQGGHDRGCVKTIDGLISRMERAKKSRCSSNLLTFLG
jgi:hypothetical protein